MNGCTLIIGYGSDLRGDDALGPAAATMLEEAVTDPSVSVVSRASLTPELAHDVSLVERVIFIDCDATLPPGRIERREVTASRDNDAMVHFLDPPALLGWARQLFGSAPPGVLFAVGGATFDCADDLSPAVRSRMPELIARVTAELAKPTINREYDHA